MTTSPALDATEPPAGRRSRSMWIRLALMLAVPPGLWWVARLAAAHHVKTCAFQLTTGLPCPGCGMTRAMLHLVEGDLWGSLRMHPLGVVLAACFAAALAATVAGLFTGTDPVERFLERHGTRFAAGLVVLLLSVWILRAFVFPEWSPDPIR